MGLEPRAQGLEMMQGELKVAVEVACSDSDHVVDDNMNSSMTVCRPITSPKVRTDDSVSEDN